MFIFMRCDYWYDKIVLPNFQWKKKAIDIKSSLSQKQCQQSIICTNGREPKLNHQKLEPSKNEIFPSLPWAFLRCWRPDRSARRLCGGGRWWWEQAPQNHKCRKAFQDYIPPIVPSELYIWVKCETPNKMNNDDNMDQKHRTIECL